MTPPPAAEPAVPPPGSPGAAEPSPPPVAVAPATGRVTVVGEASVVLSSGGQTFVPPGDVPVGTYEITATFPGAAPVKGKKSLVVEPGGIHELRCSARMMTCDPK